MSQTITRTMTQTEQQEQQTPQQQVTQLQGNVHGFGPVQQQDPPQNSPEPYANPQTPVQELANALSQQSQPRTFRNRSQGQTQSQGSVRPSKNQKRKERIAKRGSSAAAADAGDDDSGDSDPAQYHDTATPPFGQQPAYVHFGDSSSSNHMDPQQQHHNSTEQQHNYEQHVTDHFVLARAAEREREEAERKRQWQSEQQRYYHDNTDVEYQPHQQPQQLPDPLIDAWAYAQLPSQQQTHPQPVETQAWSQFTGLSGGTRREAAANATQQPFAPNTVHAGGNAGSQTFWTAPNPQMPSSSNPFAGIYGHKASPASWAEAMQTAVQQQTGPLLPAAHQSYTGANLFEQSNACFVQPQPMPDNPNIGSFDFNAYGTENPHLSEAWRSQHNQMPVSFGPPQSFHLGGPNLTPHDSVYMQRSHAPDFVPEGIPVPGVFTHPAFQNAHHTSGTLFSPFVNPRPTASLPPAYSVAPPAIPIGDWHGNPVGPGLNHTDFAPSHASPLDPNQHASVNGNGFGPLYNPTFGQQFSQMHSAQSPFHYAHTGQSSNMWHENGPLGGIFGNGGWGEGGGEPDDIGAAPAWATPQSTAVAPTPFIPIRPNFVYCGGGPPLPPPAGPPPRGPSGPLPFGSLPGQIPGPAVGKAAGYTGPPMPGTPWNYGPAGTQAPPGHTAPRPSFPPGFMPPGPPGPPGPFPPRPPGPFPPGPPGPFPPGPPGMVPGPPGPPVYYQPGYYPGPPGPPPPRPPAKRWLPPPSWTPGGQGQPSFKQFLWLLAAWCRLTSMEWCDRGLAVALSLGGRGRTIAMSLPHAVLASTQGLSILIQRLESELGTELQDRTRDASRKFLAYRRSKGQSARDHILYFEQAYQLACDHGLSLSTTMLSTLLVQTAGLSASQEEWVMGCVGGDWSRYAQIRQALRRLPSLDHRHDSEAGVWPVVPAEDKQQVYPASSSWPEHGSSAAGASNEYTPFTSTGLTVPAAEDTHNGNSDTDSDDFCSTGPSETPAQAYMSIAQAWAFQKKRKHLAKKVVTTKGGKPRFFRKRKGTGKGTNNNAFTLEDQQAFATRNEDVTIPPGWKAEDWLKRTPCPGCGSRFHRNCTLQKGSGKGGAGKTAFAVFCTVATYANSLVLPNSSSSQCSYHNDNATSSTMFSEPIVYECDASNTWSSQFNHALLEREQIEQQNVNMFSHETTGSWSELPREADKHQGPFASVPYVCPVLHAYQLPAFMVNHSVEFDSWLKAADSSFTFVGLEPLDQEFRKARLETFTIHTRKRFGLMLDTGAPESCAGSLWVERFIHDMDISHMCSWINHSARLGGIGAGTAEVHHKVTMPIGVEAMNHPCTWTTQVLSGIGAKAPALLGLQSMVDAAGIIDLRSFTYVCNAPDGSRTSNQCYSVSGHMILPIDWLGSPIVLDQTTKAMFLSDSLGLSIWFSDTEQAETNTHEDNTFPMSGSDMEHAFAQLTTCTNNIEQTNNDSNATWSTQFEDFIQQTDITQHPLSLAFTATPVLPAKGSQVIQTSQTGSSSVSRKAAPVLPTLEDPPPRPPGFSSKGGKIEQIQTFVTTLNEQPTTTTQQDAETVFHAHTISNNTRRLMEKNGTYMRKYKPLHPSTPTPNTKGLYTEPWDFWELWAGTAHLTKTAWEHSLVCGPPISHEFGWCLSLKHHQKEILRLQSIHRPKVIFAAPTCGPWSCSGNSMDSEIREGIRTEQREVFGFYLELCKNQTRHGHFHLMEQPKSSALLKQEDCLELFNLGSSDFHLCMCCHGLKDAVSRLPHMKPTTLRGTVVLSNRTVRWCTCTVKHEILQGHNSSGQLRTSLAQGYTPLFCSRLIQDVKSFLKSEGHKLQAFPTDASNPTWKPRGIDEEALSDDEANMRRPPAEQDPYEREDEEIMEDLQHTIVDFDKLEEERRLARALAPKPQVVEPKSKFKAAPPKRAEPIEIPPQGDSSGSRELAVQPKPQEPAVEPLPPGEGLALARNRPAELEDQTTLNNITKVGARLPPTGIRTIQTGTHLKVMQEMFGTPHGRLIKLVILSSKPQNSATPEPMLSRKDLTSVMTLVKHSEDTAWTIEPWNELKNTTRYAKRPLWTITLFATTLDDKDLADHLASTPIEDVEERRIIEQSNLQSLPVVLRTLTVGDDAEKIRLLLQLHKRLYHRSEEELRTLLSRSGVPLRCLALVKPALKLCEECNRWQVPHASPAIKIRLSNTFNHLIYADLVYCSVGEVTHIFLVIVDDAIRFCKVGHVEYKDFHTLVTATKHHWFSAYGPPRRWRSDRESAFANDTFGIFLESTGTERELILAKESHSMLGPLDRKVKIIRLTTPRIIDMLSQDSISVDGDEIASELTYCLNSQLSYGGTTPYACLYGREPTTLWNDETEQLSATDGSLPFHELQHVRMRSIQAFQGALLRYRLEQSQSRLSRSDKTENYIVGAVIDIYIKPARKDVEGWRGPAILIAFVGEGLVTVRWQSTLRDLPMRYIRPHVTLARSSKLVAPAPNAPTVDVPAVVAEEQAMFCQIRNTTEAFLGETDQLRSPYLDSLISVTSCLQLGTQQLHACDTHDSKITWSRDATRDSQALYTLAYRLAQDLRIPNFAGLSISAGRRHSAPHDNVATSHCFSWIDPMFMKFATNDGKRQIDWVDFGACTLDTLHMLRTIVLYQGNKETMPLSDMLKAAVNTEEREEQPNRVREQFPEDATLQHPNNEFDDLGPSVSEQEETETLVAQLRSYRLKHGPSTKRFNGEAFVINPEAFHNDCTQSYSSTFMLEPETEPDVSEIWLCFDSGSCTYYPLEKDCRPLTWEEIQAKGPEVRAACLKELQSWVKLTAVKPCKRKEYRQRTGLALLPARWVIEYKRKGGVLVIKCRLCLKGFAERNQASLHTAAPTASRQAHRQVCFLSATNGWPIYSLDIGTAFLQGYTFAEINESGTMTRQPCGFVPPDAQLFELLAELDPAWKEAAASPDEWGVELLKGVYGLKDAPLLWFMRIDAFLKGPCGMKAMRHDPLCYTKTRERSNKTHSDMTTDELEIMISLHVDDILGTSDDAATFWLHTKLESEFGTMKKEIDSFRHYGLDVHRDISTKHVYLDQRSYLDQLQPFPPKGRTAKATIVSKEDNTSYRSLVSAIAWAGITSPLANSIASLFQGFLPEVTLEHMEMLNCALAQLLQEYAPLCFRHGFSLREASKLRIIVLADSSLANSQKYSQGMFHVFLCHKDNAILCGASVLLSFKSAKSKRVAHSTYHAETLALTCGCEEAQFLQGWFYELTHPHASIAQLVEPPCEDIIQIVGCTDCHDLHAALCSPASPTGITNKAMMLYIVGLRELRSIGRVQQWCWVDTRDNLSNLGTKLEKNGTLPSEDLQQVVSCGCWEPIRPYRWGSMLIDPTEVPRVPLPVPPKVKRAEFAVDQIPLHISELNTVSQSEPHS